MTLNTENKHTGTAVIYRTSTCKDLSFKLNPRSLYLRVHCCWILHIIQQFLENFMFTQLNKVISLEQ